MWIINLLEQNTVSNDISVETFAIYVEFHFLFSLYLVQLDTDTNIQLYCTLAHIKAE